MSNLLSPHGKQIKSDQSCNIKGPAVVFKSLPFLTVQKFFEVCVSKHLLVRIEFISTK